jgi:tripartite-type tricarboxylate transporter receptor subunit TctC
MTSRVPLLRRTLCAAALGLALAPGLSSAQAWPSKPVRFVVNFPAGGPIDTLARSMSDALQSSLKQPFVVENKAGAGGNIGAEQVAKGAADGYTVLFSIDSTFTVNPHIYKAMAFKAEQFRPVMVMASSGLLVGASQASGFKSLKDLVAAGKARTLNFSNAGSGSPGHLALEILTDAAGIRIQHVPYKGNTPAVTALLAGEVDAGVLATPGLVPHVKAGKVAALAVTSRKRSGLLPEVPTVAELGLKGLEQEILYLALVPAATPEPVVQALQKAMAEAFQRPDIQARLAGLDLFPEGQVGADARKRLADLSARYAPIVKATGMQAE